jgi:cell division inhibitor SepF
MSDGLCGTASRVRRAVRRHLAQEGEMMSALHRLKAYFGMVPTDEFDDEFYPPQQFNETRFDVTQPSAAGFEGYRSGHRSSYSASAHDSAGCHYSGNAHQALDPGFDRAATRRPSRPGLDRLDLEGHDDGYPAPAGHYAAPRVHPARSPSSFPTDARGRSAKATEPWSADVPVRGTLAIDATTADTPQTDGRTTIRQPISSQPFAHEPRADLLADDEAHPLSRIVTLHPHSYNEARSIGERYREGNPVIMNLTAMEDRDAKRLVDFAAGLAFALRGSIDKVTNKVFLLSPPNVDVSAEDRRRIAEGRLFT